jgi:hypothetical protein
VKTPVLMSFTPFDASTEDRLRSSLSSIHDAVKAAPFDHDVHHRGYETEAAHGSLEPPPTRRLRRTFQYSTTLSHQRLHDTVTARRLIHDAFAVRERLGDPASSSGLLLSTPS